MRECHLPYPKDRNGVMRETKMINILFVTSWFVDFDRFWNTKCLNMNRANIKKIIKIGGVKQKLLGIASLLSKKELQKYLSYWTRLTLAVIAKHLFTFSFTLTEISRVKQAPSLELAGRPLCSTLIKPCNLKTKYLLYTL